MEKFYSVTCSGKSCGKVSVRKQGLYYHFHCRCTVDREDIYRLVLSCDDHRESLGILIPSEDAFCLRTKVPVKKLPEGEWSFCITSKQMEDNGLFIPISPEEPFAYISRLKESFLTSQNGQPGIQLEKMQE